MINNACLHSFFYYDFYFSSRGDVLTEEFYVETV